MMSINLFRVSPKFQILVTLFFSFFVITVSGCGDDAKTFKKACQNGAIDYFSENHPEYISEKISFNDLCSYIQLEWQNEVEAEYQYNMEKHDQL